MNAFKRFALSATVASLAAWVSVPVASASSDFDTNSQYWSKEFSKLHAPYVAIGSSSHHGVTLALTVSYGYSCNKPEIRIMELDNRDFAKVSTRYKESITGAKFRIDKGTIWNYEAQGDTGGEGTYTYNDGVFMFLSRHNIASDGFFPEFITGKTLYYTDDSLDKTYHFSLNGSAAAYDWFVQECNKFKGANGKNDESDIWDETSKEKRPGYDGPEWGT